MQNYQLDEKILHLQNANDSFREFIVFTFPSISLTEEGFEQRELMEQNDIGYRLPACFCAGISILGFAIGGIVPTIIASCATAGALITGAHWLQPYQTKRFKNNFTTKGRLCNYENDLLDIMLLVADNHIDYDESLDTIYNTTQFCGNLALKRNEINHYSKVLNQKAKSIKKMIKNKKYGAQAQILYNNYQKTNDYMLAFEDAYITIMKDFKEGEKLTTAQKINLIEMLEDVEYVTPMNYTNHKYNEQTKEK